MEILRDKADDGKSSSSGGSDVGSAVADLEDFLDVLLLQDTSRLAEFFAAQSAETVDIKKGRRHRGSKIKTFLQFAKRLPHHDNCYFSLVMDSSVFRQT